MSNIIIILILYNFSSSCGLEAQNEYYSFKNFENTSVSELAKAVEDENLELIKELTRGDVDIDTKDPKYHQTLLVASIVNNKKEAFLELLKAGSNPNMLLGFDNTETPLLCAIENQGNCDTFFIEKLLAYGADPNLRLTHLEPKVFSTGGVPILTAIGIRDDEANDCLSGIKILVENGAKLNSCRVNPATNLCEGIITRCLDTRSMAALKYFVMEKKVIIPDTVFVIGSIDPSTERVYGLKEILSSETFAFRGAYTERQRKIKDEILNYLKRRK